MKDLISVIVPVYNTAQYLSRCIESIVQQSYRNIEIILVDDGSTDGSAQICDSYAQKDKRIVVLHKENAGVSAARNAGLAIAKGTFIGCVDSDDWIESDMYQRMYEACIQYHVPMSMCRYARVSENGVVKEGSQEVRVLTREEMLRCYIRGDKDTVVNNCVWSKLFARELILDMAFAEGRVSEDIMYTTKLLCKLEKGVYIDSCLYNYKEDRVGSIMNSDKTQRVIQDEIPFWKEHITYIRQMVSEEMGNYAEYYFYRRLLSYYIELERDTKTKALAKWIQQLMYEEKETIRFVYRMDYVPKGDKVRMNMYLLNHKLYACINKWYERIVIPLRQGK